MKSTLFLLVIVILISGCAALSQKKMAAGETMPVTLEAAKQSFEAGELYRARKITEKIIQQDPENKEAEKLMAQIIEKELSQYKDLFEEDKKMEDLDADSKNQIEVWLERSRTLLEARQYDDALLAAEKVFMYDGQNRRASELIDEIRGKAMKEGKAQVLARNHMVRNEIRERVEKYRKQAREAMLKQQYGEAEFMVEKILLLEPEDKEGLELQKEIKEHKQMAIS